MMDIGPIVDAVNLLQQEVLAKMTLPTFVDIDLTQVTSGELLAELRRAIQVLPEDTGRDGAELQKLHGICSTVLERATQSE